MRLSLGVTLLILTASGVWARADRRDEYRSLTRQSLERRAFRDQHYQETRLAQSQSGNDAIDAAGRRVRMEEYILRPEANVFERRVLNYRDGRVDEFSAWKRYTYDLPASLDGFLQQRLWQQDEGPLVKLTDNILQEVVHRFSRGGHSYQERMMGNLLSPATGDDYTREWISVWVSVDGRDKLTTSFYRPEDGVIRSVTYGVAQGDGTIHFGDLEHSLPTITSEGVPDAATPWRSRLRMDFADGTFLDFQSTLLDSSGNVMSLSDVGAGGSDFASLRSPVNHNLVIRASEFRGQEIDLVIPSPGHRLFANPFLLGARDSRFCPGGVCWGN